MGVSALTNLYPQLSTPRIVGTDIAHAVPLTLIAGTGHGILGSVDAIILSSRLTGSIPGVVIGSWMTFKSPSDSSGWALPPFSSSSAVGW